MELWTNTPTFDFVTGALTAMGLVLIKVVYDLYQYPTEKAIQSVATRPVPHRGDDGTVTIWGFFDSGPSETNGYLCDNYSALVERVEAYLRLKQVKYTKMVTNGLQESPRHKVPVANVYGTMVDDSSRILAVLQDKLDDEVDSTLSSKQRAEGTMLRALLFGSLYHVIHHARIGITEGREDVRAYFARLVPAPLLPIVYAQLVREGNAKLHGALIGQLPRQEIWEIGRQGLRAIALLLSNRQYILGTKEATVYDTDVYSIVAHFFFEPILGGMQWVQDIHAEHPALEQYIAGLRNQLFPDLKTKYGTL
jgi:Glutathione S-transferase N-terminal domain